MREYNEEEELNRYVWEFFSQFFTTKELEAQRAVHFETKAQDTDSEATQRMLRKKYDQNNPELIEAMNNWPQFRSKARKRVMEKHSGEISINRCQDCSRILRTPEALQCLWCGADWH